MTASATLTTPAGIAGHTWVLDPAHSSVEFSVKHLMISTAKGRFSKLGGKFQIDPARPTEPVMQVEIDAASIDTRDEKRDAHLKSADFFDVERNPVIAFTARRLEGNLDGKFNLIGDLTMHGRTKPVVLSASNEGRMTDPWGNEKLAFSASTKVNRLDFDLKWNVALEAGGVLVGEDVKITIEAQFARQAS